ncbi:lysylphosphatidylglycerol synthase domain-containing protein [Limnohabitans sp. G3-2]|uniref:lysylphosphatidylglycerol synthase domain-containing protein n=1 Tax=Limnohabitans sp. G3-2 TaxID=1100711 RepID=UPI001303FE99|nr:lysylphosphatidylglycerol synthase domain-containing protein [Limnohabitans sp. G3-2]
MAVLLGLALALSLFVWAWQQLDRPDLSQWWRAVPPWLWATAAAVWACTFILRAIRLRQEWQWKRQISLRTALHVVLLHNSAALLMPLRSGELGYPLLVRKVFDASWPESLRSLLWLRFQDAVVLALLVLLFWPFTPPIAAALIAAPVLVALLASRQHLEKFVLICHGRVEWLGFIWHGRDRHAGWLLSLGNWLLKIAVVAILLQVILAESVSLGMPASVSAALGGEIAALLPLQGPASLGTYETGVWLFSGLPLEQAPLLGMVALLVHLFCLGVSLLLALLVAAVDGPAFWRLSHGKNRPDSIQN